MIRRGRRERLTFRQRFGTRRFGTGRFGAGQLGTGRFGSGRFGTQRFDTGQLGTRRFETGGASWYWRRKTQKSQVKCSMASTFIVLAVRRPLRLSGVEPRRFNTP